MTGRACDIVAVVDDDDDLRAALMQTLELEGLRTTGFADGGAALAAIDADFSGIVVTDLRMPMLDGAGLFARLTALDADLPVVIITGHGDVPTAVDLMRRGAYDFITKPFAPDRLMPTIRRALEKRGLVLENRALRNAGEGGAELGFAGVSPQADRVRTALRKFAAADCPVLVTGEAGTGRSLCAGLLHRLSRRIRQQLVTIDCATLSEEDGAAALAGHVSGAFRDAPLPRTGALRQADRGTLVLDNIEALPMPLQRLIERAIASATVTPVGSDIALPIDVAIVATAGPDLDRAVEERRFAASLYHRLSGAKLDLPPLRERAEDIPALFGMFLQDAVEQASAPFPTVGPDIVARLRTGTWPGNAHELAALAREVALGVERGAGPSPAADAEPDGLRAAVARYEAEYISAALAEARGDIEQARAALGLPRKTLYDKIARHGLAAADFRDR